MNLQSVAVHVPADRIADAERALAEAKAANVNEFEADHTDGINHVWTDSDGDHLSITSSVVRDTTTLRVQERRGEQGFVDAR